MSLFPSADPANRLTDRERLSLELEGLHAASQREDAHKRADYAALHAYQLKVGWLERWYAAALVEYHKGSCRPVRQATLGWTPRPYLTCS